MNSDTFGPYLVSGILVGILIAGFVWIVWNGVGYILDWMSAPTENRFWGQLMISTLVWFFLWAVIEVKWRK